MMLNGILLGLVEGATEFLPISSTGHLLLAQALLGRRDEAFNVLIQVGPILASLVVFRHRVLGWFRHWNDKSIRKEWIQVLTCFFLTGIGGLALKKMGLKLPETLEPIAWATLLGAFVLFAVETRRNQSPSNSDVSWRVVFAVAAAQLVAAAFPGTSRSGACVMAALLCGLARPQAVEFSFLVGIPTMLAAGGLELLGTIKHGQGAQLVTPETLVAFATATLSAFAVCRWLLYYVQTRTFLPFAWYRLILGLFLLVGLQMGLLQDLT